MQTWFEILSELFVNIAWGWFALVFIEPNVSGIGYGVTFQLFDRLALGILSLVIAKRFREAAKGIL